MTAGSVAQWQTSELRVGGSNPAYDTFMTNDHWLSGTEADLGTEGRGFEPK